MKNAKEKKIDGTDQFNNRSIISIGSSYLSFKSMNLKNLNDLLLIIEIVDKV